MKYLFAFVISMFFHFGFAQDPYPDYIGAGHDIGIVTISSSDLSKQGWNQAAHSGKSLSGDGLEGRKVEMARLLHQASMGFSKEELLKATDLGIDQWIEEQFNKTPSSFLDQAFRILSVLNEYHISQGEDPENLPRFPSWKEVRYGWYQNAILNEDQLRQRVAFALSQILVISDQSDLAFHGDGLASFYDVLMQHAFGNFRDLLYDVTLHPSMGFYLSHLNNPKEIPEENIHPDQNYAREIMQLFSIGLFQLNQDGTPVLDSNGNTIPTYNNDHIVEMAKVFTGLGIGGVTDPNSTLYFGRGLYSSDLTIPMIMYEEWHQEGEKHIINDHVIAAGQTGLEDINEAIDVLFNHPNVGPFISKQLIQRMVTSNPTNEYVARVAGVFNDDGTGVRGNLKEVIRAILLDEEARSCDFILDPHHGKMSEPVLRNTHFLKAVGYSQTGDEFLHHAWGLGRDMFQAPLSSPSVFNFYRPDYTPVGQIADNNLVAPEFQIFNSISAIQYPNYVYAAAYWEYGPDQWEGEDWNSAINAFHFIEPSQEIEVLINEFDVLFCNGNMSSETREIIKEALKAFDTTTLSDTREKINMAMYLTLISPDYIIEK